MFSVIWRCAFLKWCLGGEGKLELEGVRPLRTNSAAVANIAASIMAGAVSCDTFPAQLMSVSALAAVSPLHDIGGI